MKEQVKNSLRNMTKCYFDLLLLALPSEMRKEVMEELYIAGGMIRSLIIEEEIKDIDVWFKSDKLINKIKALNLGFTSQNAVSFYTSGYQFQLVFSRTQQPLDLVEEFDFTMNQNYYDPSTNEIYIADYEAVKNKQLIVSPKCRNALGTLARVNKFNQRGYKIPCRNDLLRLGVLISKEPINTFDDLEHESKLFFSEEQFNEIDFVDKTESPEHTDSGPVFYGATRSGSCGGEDYL